MNSIISQAE